MEASLAVQAAVVDQNWVMIRSAAYFARTEQVQRAEPGYVSAALT